MLVNVDLPAGVFANGTARQAKNRYRLSNLIRWPDGANLQPVGGWVARTTSTVTGIGPKSIVNDPAGLQRHGQEVWNKTRGTMGNYGRIPMAGREAKNIPGIRSNADILQGAKST